MNYNVLTDEMINRIKEENFYLLAFTIDNEEVAQEFLEKGVDTICTNFIIPEELPDGGSFFGKKGRR